jgi:hypothetical protein
MMGLQQCRCMRISFVDGNRVITCREGNFDVQRGRSLLKQVLPGSDWGQRSEVIIVMERRGMG